MINLFNRKNLFALFIGLACLSANSAWAAETAPDENFTPKAVGVELATTLIRDAAIIFEQHSKSKYGSESKKALIFSSIANALRLANDGISLTNEYSNGRLYASEAVSGIPMLYDLADTLIKVKKLVKKEYKTNEEAIADDQQVSIAIQRINKIAPFIEIIAATARSTSKCFGDYKHKQETIKLCTAFLTLSRALEFFAQAKINKSSKMQVVTIVIAAAAIAAFIFDYIKIDKKPVTAASEPISEASASSTTRTETRTDETPETPARPAVDAPKPITMTVAVEVPVPGSNPESRPMPARAEVPSTGSVTTERPVTIAVPRSGTPVDFQAEQPAADTGWFGFGWAGSLWNALTGPGDAATAGDDTDATAVLPL